MKSYFPILEWAGAYTRGALANDLLAAVIVIIMLIPQSLAYALLAGLPAEAGLYASIVPALIYAVFGTSRALAVGPVAVVSLMTASAIGDVAATGTAGYAIAALTLAGLSGVMLMAMGFLRLGFLANFLSHPVIAGFITASGLIIAVSQLRHIFGIDGGGHSLIEQGTRLLANLAEINFAALTIGAVAIAFLVWTRGGLKPLLIRLGLGARLADVVAKAGPALAVVASTGAVAAFGLTSYGLDVVGDVPRGLPPFTMPSLSLELLEKLWLPALLISIIGFVESVSIARTLAAKKRQRIDPDQELIGLGAANLGAAFTGGYPVTGGFARSVVNFDAGAETPAAGAFTALGLALAALFLTPLVYFLPKATLAATIIVAVLSLIDLTILRTAWRFSKADFFAVAATILLTLGFGVEAGISAGVVLSILFFMLKTSRPHVAEVGLVPGTEHFRNILRHDVETRPDLLSLRIDESLYFANAGYLETLLYNRLAGDQRISDVVLMCSAVNEIDMSALETLEAINHRFGDLGIRLHLSEVKGPVMDRLKRSNFIDQMTGRIYLSQFDAYRSIAVLPPDGKDKAA